MDKHTPGPWKWSVTPGGDIRLCTPDRGLLYVMGFERKGMRGAQPRFSIWGDGPRERRGGIMHGFAEAGGAEHPDAKLMAAAPDLLEMTREYRDLVFSDYAPAHKDRLSRIDDAIERATGVRP